MKKETIINGNKLIDEFIGLKPVKTFGKYLISQDHCMCSEETEEKAMHGFASIAKYNSSWDWLMPIVKKCYYKAEDIEAEEWCVRIQTAVVSDLNATYNEVIEFIKWYNENK